MTSSRIKASTVSRRMSVVASSTAHVIDDVLQHSPAEYVRRPSVLAESPTLGLTHLQFEALLTTARASTNQFDFALIGRARLARIGAYLGKVDPPSSYTYVVLHMQGRDLTQRAPEASGVIARTYA
jgi:hypothetical protein